MFQSSSIYRAAALDVKACVKGLLTHYPLSEKIALKAMMMMMTTQYTDT